MKKRFLLITLIGLLMTGCDLNDIFAFAPGATTSETGQTISYEPSNNNSQNQNTPPTTPVDTTVHVTSVTLSEDTINIVEGDAQQLSYTVLPDNATNKNVTWSTSNSTIASVDNGLIKGWNVGTVTITITSEDGNKTDTCTVNVSKKQNVSHTTSTSIVFDDLGFSTSGGQ